MMKEKPICIYIGLRWLFKIRMKNSLTKCFFFFFNFMNTFFYNYELIKQLFRMHSKRSESQQIYKELLCPNNFLFSKLTILKATYILWCIKSKTCLFIICCQLLVFPSNSVRICSIKL